MARRKKSSENAVNLFSFQDVLACLTGVLIMVSLLLCIDGLSDNVSIIAGASGTTVLVGHEPTTTLLTRALVSPADAARVDWFKKGGAAYVRADGTLAWQHQPKALTTRTP